MWTRIVIVASNDDFRRDLGLYLSMLDAGYEVAGAGGPAGEALARVARLRCDIALVDLDRRERDGHALALAGEIRASSPATAVIVLGNLFAEDYRQAALDAGATEYIDKLDLIERLPVVLASVARAIHAPARQPLEAAPASELHMSPATDTGGATVATLSPRATTAPVEALAAWCRQHVTAAGAAPAAWVATIRAAGRRKRVFTAWQYLHILIAFVCLLVVNALQHARSAGLEGREASFAIILAALAGILVLEVRQLLRARPATWFAGSGGGRDGNESCRRGH